ncbi:hypothetical protein LUZ63_001408 [Rhynchospora breviuscula]|uniref:DDE Tnp4 domain-containing protein n=1 Tax=Rhynchospora breviuscula TaxID=2022672 RepID=A0A9Q0CY60_9POAL|nr:hypothetical protein LUZ63_001408 [Rhynchospora breviuscula]
MLVVMVDSILLISLLYFHFVGTPDSNHKFSFFISREFQVLVPFQFQGAFSLSGLQSIYLRINTMDSDDEIEEQNLMMAAMLMMMENNKMRNTLTTCMLEWEEVTNDKPLSGPEWIMDQLDGHYSRCYESYRMSTDHFNALCNELKLKGLQSKVDVIIEEQVAMFLQLVGQSHNMRKIGEDFQHSTETVWRCFRNVLHYVLKLGSKYIKLPDSNTPIHPWVSEGTQYAPFKDALGAIGGTHIPAFPNQNDMSKEIFRNRKGVDTQNVMAAVDFDGNFVAVIAGWEGSAHDNMILHSAVEKGFFIVPPGKFYLVDAGYANTLQFLAPFRGIAYHLRSFHDCARTHGEYRYNNPQECYNHRHAQLRIIVERTFGILKGRFHILKDMHPFKYKIQTKIVRACCILHNFINHQNSLQNVSDDNFFEHSEENNAVEDEGTQVGDVQTTDLQNGGDFQNGANLRNRIKDALWEMM